MEENSPSGESILRGDRGEEAIGFLRDLKLRERFHPLIRLLVRPGFVLCRGEPLAATILGFVAASLAGFCTARGILWAGGALILLSGWFDLVDGALARATGKASRFGALLDSAMDRLSEIALFAGLLLHFALRGDSLLAGILPVFAALTGSLMVSYMRARAESLGVEWRGGFFPREVRIPLLASALIGGHFEEEALQVLLWIIAGGTYLTAAQRLIFVKRREKGD